jgi:hypothetical protein
MSFSLGRALETPATGARLLTITTDVEEGAHFAMFTVPQGHMVLGDPFNVVGNLVRGRVSSADTVT